MGIPDSAFRQLNQAGFAEIHFIQKKDLFFQNRDSGVRYLKRITNETL